MLKRLKRTFKTFFHARQLVLTIAFSVMFAVIIWRVFDLQVLNGGTYQESFTNQIHKTVPIDATRGNIYDCNGNLLAYNEMTYALTIRDSGSYASTSIKNETLNEEIAVLIRELEKNGESIYNSFEITMAEDGSYSYNVEGTSLKRFLADVFGKSSYSSLEYNETYGFDEADATAENVMTYLMGKDKYQVSLKKYDARMAYEITVVRYAISENLYSRYKSTTIAENVGEATIAYVEEHSDTLTGAAIEESTVRRYNDSVYFAALLGYTGKISAAEYDELSAEDPSYSTNDIVGKAGLEQYYESYLKGTKGEEEFYTNTVGKITQEISRTESVPGNDLYISIDADLQKAVYQLLEQEIAGIVYSNIKSNDITMNEVYYALINNNIIDISNFSGEDASFHETYVYNAFLSEHEKALSQVENELEVGPETLNQMSDSMVSYFTSIISMLKNDDILLTGQIDTDDDTYIDWRDGKLSPKDYLYYCIKNQWIDTSLLDMEDQYVDAEEAYNALCTYIEEEIADDKEFSKLVYQGMLEDGTITGRQLCLILFDQGAIEYNDQDYQALDAGTLSPADFMLEKINNLEITPAQLALDPCTGSCIMTDPDTGEIKALVTYPGYDANKLANGVDAEYYASLQEDKSNPQWNYATQEKTAPGSTFKMLTSTAGLAEGLIDTETEIKCTGVFEEVDNKPECWIWKQKKTHGDINVSEALRDSCNIFYYTLGYELSQLNDEGTYSDSTGISYIQKYASIFGLDSKTGLEIAESQSEVADQYPVMAAIGQSDNNYTTAALSRYVTAVTSGKVYDYQLMSKITDTNGNTIVSYSPSYTDISDLLTDQQWYAIHKGMRMVCLGLSAYTNCDLTVAGKTGTAQQSESRPNHALFVGYCPYEDPEITIACRIAYGSSSHNTACLAKNILYYYFGEKTLDELLGTKATGVNSSSSNTVTD